MSINSYHRKPQVGGGEGYGQRGQLRGITVVKAGRPQGGPKGRTEEANALAVFLRDLTKDFTVRELADRYKISKTSWGEYRAGTKLIESHMLQRVVRDLVRDEQGRHVLAARAKKLHQLAKAAENSPPPPGASVRSTGQSDQVLHDADASVRESEELLHALREVIAHLQATSAEAPSRSPERAPGDAAASGRTPAVAPGVLDEATEQLARLEEVQAAAEHAQVRAQEQREADEMAEADVLPPLLDTAPLTVAVPATDPALTEVATALTQVRTALDAQRAEVAGLVSRLGLHLPGPALSTVVLVPGEVLTHPVPSGSLPARREPIPARRRLGRRLVTGAVAVAGAATIAAGGWHFTHRPASSTAAPAPTPATLAPTAPTTAAPIASPPPSTSATSTPAPKPRPSRVPTTAPPAVDRPISSPKAVRSAPPSAPPVQWGHITNGNSGLCLAVPAASRQSGKILNQYPCGDYADHYWKTEPTADGAVRIVNYNSRQCLSVADSSKGTAAPVVQATCGQSEAQDWQLEEHPDGTMIVNVNSGQCLAVPAASTDALIEVNQYPCGDYADHYWHLEGS
ncbi:RICIN domain-containing protein [Streptomyces sp. NPDC056749]|uniref:RICIN domain-containing protein n=1 Tax=Streptomyces sp. NPDC056749 TaxID=3345936 RepID=UPI0036C0F9C2